MENFSTNNNKLKIDNYTFIKYGTGNFEYYNNILKKTSK